ncbi:Cupin-like domain-containing protein [Rhizobiales bacterium GAS191]|nr:Cupin-like domain-containing protein [Rhizobiales bacterium GAS191]
MPTTSLPPEAKPIFTDWTERHAELFGNQPIRLAHELHRSPLFSREELARLIEVYPKQHYSLVHMGAKGERRFWREGDIQGLSGEEVIAAIEAGRMWLNLRRVKDVDPRYADLVEAIFQEWSQRMPGFSSFNHSAGILISSPKAQVYYHADLPGQALWQIIGSKRVYVYPPTAPFLTPKHLEGIALFGVEVDMPYEEWYDDHAVVLELEPGQMLHWPLNAPHRVENHDCLNVSMTLEYWSEDIRRSHIVTMGNAILRNRLGVTPKSRATSGPSFYAKAILQRALRDTSWVKKERSARRPVDFKLDRTRLGAILDIEATGSAG